MVRCLTLAFLLHLLAILVIGTAPGGPARPGKGPWGALNVTLSGAEAGRSRDATPLGAGPVGRAREQRFGGAPRPEERKPLPQPGAAKQGSFAPQAETRPAPPAEMGDVRPTGAQVEPLPRATAPPAAPAVRDADLTAVPAPAPAPVPLPRSVPAPPPPQAVAQPEPMVPAARPTAPQAAVADVKPLEVPLVLPSAAPLAGLTQQAVVQRAAPAPRPTVLQAQPSHLPLPQVEPAPLPAPLPAPPRAAPRAASALDVKPADVVTAPSALPPVPPAMAAPQRAAAAPVASVAVQPPAALLLPDANAVLPTAPSLPAQSAPVARVPAPARPEIAVPAPVPVEASSLALPSALPQVAAPAAPQPGPPAAPQAPNAAAPTATAAQPPAGRPEGTALPAAGSPPAAPVPGAPDAGPRVGHDVATPPSVPASAGKLDLQPPRAMGGPVSSQGSRGLLNLAPPPPERKSKLAEDIEKAAREDCRKAYADKGLLAVVPLINDATKPGSRGCKW